MNLDVFDIGGIDEGEFHVKFLLRNKEDGFKWALIAVYGAAQDGLKGAFLAELAQTCSKECVPVLVGGDFNIIRNPQEKNNDRYDVRWPFLFNAIIDGLNLRELKLSNRKFTWANSRNTPTYETLDRILASTEWEAKFPRSTVQALSREFSDHTPLLLDTGSGTHGCKQPLFKFELGWLLRDGFHGLVADVWHKAARGRTPLQRWQYKIQKVRQFLRGWARNESGKYKKEKVDLIRRTAELDIKAETQTLSRSELDLKHQLKERLAQLLREEELKWYQRAKTTKLLHGDCNTKYFHLVANGKQRKTRIFQLEQEEGIVVGEEKLKSYITAYYKKLFGASEKNNFSLVETYRDDIPQVSIEENDILTSIFTEHEVKAAVFQMEHNKAPGPDGFPIEFY
jgi:hypothetical protein